MGYRRTVATLGTFCLLLFAACGDDAKTTEAPRPTADEPGDTRNENDGASADAQGCGPEAVTDPDDMSVGRSPARCAPGSPAPQPLPQREKVTVSSSFLLEFNSPLLLAESLGEFDKENLDVEIVSVRFSDAIPQLANGRLDVGVAGLEVALFNAANNGLPVKAVLANYYPPHSGDYDVAQTGLWCRRDSFTTPEDPDLAEASNMTWGSAVGKGSASVYASVAEIRRQGVDDFHIVETQVSQVPSSDMVAALQNKAIDCGIVLDPLWPPLAQDDNFFLAASSTPGEPLGIYAFGKRLLQERPDIGDAFTRAFIRTVNTYFDGDYHQDDEVMAAIAEATGQTVEQLRRVDSLVMDWEFRAGTTPPLVAFW